MKHFKFGNKMFLLITITGNCCSDCTIELLLFTYFVSILRVRCSQSYAQFAESYAQFDETITKVRNTRNRALNQVLKFTQDFQMAPITPISLIEASNWTQRFL